MGLSIDYDFILEREQQYRQNQLELVAEAAYLFSLLAYSKRDKEYIKREQRLTELLKSVGWYREFIEK